MKSTRRAALLGVATALFVTSPGVGFAFDLIIESRPQGKNNAQFSGLQGNWVQSQRKSSAPGLSENTPSGAQRVILSRADEGEGNQRRLTTPPAVARFLPKLKSAQELYAYVTWPNGANVQPLTITVKHADGEEKIANAQRGYGAGARTNANRWIPLGKFKFAGGDGQYIELRVDPGFSPVYPQRQVDMYADAVRFTSEELSQAELAATSADRPARRRANGHVAAIGEAGAGADADDEGLRTETAPDGGDADDAEEVAVIPFDAPPLNGAAVLDDAGDELPSFALPATNGIHWHDNLDAARQVAQMSDLKLFLFFIGEDSPETEELDAVIQAPEPAKLISREYAAARLDFAQYKEVATRLGVTRPGWIVIYDSQGKALGSITSASDPDELAEQLRRF